jgi:hypothetical protein
VSKGVFGSILGAAVVAFALLVTGCGGSDEPEALTKAEFVKQGNAICKQSESERSKVIERFSQEVKPDKDSMVKAQEELVLALVPTYEKATTKIDELGAPEGDEQKVEEIVKAREEAIEQVKANPGSAAISSLPFNDANKLLQSYGLTTCVT